MKKTPTDHVGRMVGRSSLQKENGSAPEKNVLFSEKIFCATIAWNVREKVERNGENG